MQSLFPTEPALLFDLGTSSIKYAHMPMDPNSPLNYLENPSCYAEPHDLQDMVGDKTEIKYGREAQKAHATHDLKWCLKSGQIMEGPENTHSKEAFEKNVEICYRQLQLDLNKPDLDNDEFARGHPALITQAANAAEKHTSWLAELFFEKIQAPFWVAKTQAELSMIASGNPSGIILDMGHGVAHVVAVVNFNPLERSVERYNFAGEDLTRLLRGKFLDSCGNPPQGTWSQPRWLKDATEMKETAGLFYVAKNYDEEMLKYTNPSTALPTAKNDDGNWTAPDATFQKNSLVTNDDDTWVGEVDYPVLGGQVRLGKQRFGLPEVLFNPKIAYLTQNVSVQKMVYDCVMQSGDPDL